MRLGITLTLLLLITAIQSYGCDCECIDDCSFQKIVKTEELVALVKVIS
jgi:hypothetical protein